MLDIDKLYRIALENAHLVRGFRKRYKYKELKKILDIQETKKPMILISGIRGIGKTTLMLQLFREYENALFFFADSVIVKKESLFSIVEQAYYQGFKTIFIDEIHTNPRWVEELKSIYDSFPVMVVASGSSTSDIKKGSIILGRRALEIKLNPLSFGEHYYLRTGKEYVSEFKDCLDKRMAIMWIAMHKDIEKHYRKYMEYGGFPGRENIYSVLKKMIYMDAVSTFRLSDSRVDLALRVLSFLASSHPEEFSYSSFSSMSGYSKSMVYDAVMMLEELGILRVIHEGGAKSKAKGSVKILFSHPNLRVAFSKEMFQEADIGALREEYFLFHVDNLGFSVSIPKKRKKTPDYLLSDGKRKLYVEIGGPSKKKEQIKNLDGIIFNDMNLMVLGFVRI